MSDAQTGSMELLKLTLEFAVAMNLITLRGQEPARRRETAWRWAGDAVEALQRDGDKLLVRVVPGLTSYVFNALARGLAGLAVTGGVEFEGLSWKVDY